jgi:response regulator RpfG family c-di-GMP phosphodiesterase
MRGQVLLVDDEPVVREVLSAWLGDEGYECAAASGVDEALEQAASHPFDVALLDTVLPDGDGLSLARRLRETDRELALIVVAGRRRGDAADEGMRLNVTDYLVKPFTRQQLVESVGRAVRRRKLAQPRSDRATIADQIERRTRELARAFAAAASTSTPGGILIALHGSKAEATAHADRVAKMSVTLGLRMGLSETELAVVERGALLHDIGKLALPDALLSKPGPFTHEEIGTIRTHPELGYAIVSVVPSFELPGEIVLASHEAWDGSGYPRGLAGSLIPLGARITAVTDTYDALTWSRAQGQAVGTRRAAAEMVRCSGAQFDPDVVHAWLRVLDGDDRSSFAPPVARRQEREVNNASS